MIDNSRSSVMNAVVGAVALNMVNPYIGILAIRMGATDLQLGYLSSWPNAVSVFAVLGFAAAVARSEQKQRLIAIILFLGRAAALGIAAVPWFAEDARVWALIGFWTLAVFPGSAAGSAIQSFLADVFPGRERARELAARQSWGTGAGMLVALGTGWLLDHALPYPLGYQVMFAGSVLVGLWEVGLFLRLKEQEVPAPTAGPAPRRSQSVGFGAYPAVFRHRPFAAFAMVSVLFHLTWQAAWPVFTRFQVSELMADNTWLSLITVANSTAMVLSAPLWVRAAERYGDRALLPVAAFWLATIPFLTSLMPSVQALVLLNLITGVGVTGVMLLILNNLLTVSPAEGRPLYLAVHAALISISAAIAPVAGAYLMSVMPIRTGLQLLSLFRGISAAAMLILAIWGPRVEGMSEVLANQTISERAIR